MFRSIATAAIIMMLSLTASAQVPQTISLQGVLSGGCTTCTRSVTFRIYDAETGGVPLWNEMQPVLLDSSLFNVMLGSVTPLGLAFDRQYWIGVSVEGGAEMLPRIALSTAPYSMTAQSAQSVGAGAGTSIVTALNDGTTTGTITDVRLSANIPRLDAANTWTRSNRFEGGISAGSHRVTDVAMPKASSDAATKGYVDQAMAGRGEILSANMQYDVGSTQATASPRTDWLFDVAYSSSASAATASGARIAASAGSSGNNNATALTLQATAPGTGNATALTLQSNSSGTGRAIALNAPSGALLFSGVAGGTPTSGNGTRLMWVPSKSALRAGSVSGNQWDDGNIGLNSFATGSATIASGNSSMATGGGSTASGVLSTAMGGGTTASNDYSTAIGGITTASGYASMAMGYHTTASGDYSTTMGWSTAASGDHSTAMGRSSVADGYVSMAMGYSTTASGNYSTAIGQSTTASGDVSMAMGQSTTASGYASTVSGYSTMATGDFSTAMGRSTTASDYASTALGYNTTASGGYSTALGYNTTASGDYSTASGYNTIASGDHSVVMGRSTTASGFVSTASGFNTTASGDYSTAMGNVVSTNAKVGSFVYGDASVFSVMNATADNQFSVRAAGGYRFFSDASTTAANGVFIAPSTGNLGLGNATPAQKLDVRNGNILLSNSGTPGELRLQGTGSGYTALKADGQGATNITYTLPAAVPTATGQVLSSTTGGTMSWTPLPTSLPPSGVASGDLSGTYPGPSVATVGGVTAADVASGAIAANAATDANTGSTIVMRDSHGNLSAGTITADLTGNVTGNVTGDVDGNVSGSASSFTGNLSGDVTSMGMETSISGGAVTTAKLANGAVTDSKVSDVAWGKITGAPSSLPPSGSASGDLSGSYPSPTVAKIQGSPVAATAPTSGQVLTWSGTQWAPATAAGISDWTLSGNAGTVAGTNYIGTSDNVDFVAKTNNVERLRLTSSGSLLLYGNTGTTPASGPGTRMMWIPSKGALRAGTILSYDNSEWNDASIGANSVAMGHSTKASGNESMAMGGRTIASGDWSFAIGLATVASGSGSIAMGVHASTNNQHGSFVFGDGSTYTSGAMLNASAYHQFSVRASGGYRFFSDPALTEANAVYIAPATGRVGLGNAAPSQKLEVKDGNLLLSNSGTAGELRLQGTGTGYSAFMSGAQGTTNITYTLPLSAPATDGEVLGSTIDGTMSWMALPASLPPSGTAGGDLEGEYPDPSVARLQGNAVSSASPSGGDVLTWNATTTQWEPAVAPALSLPYSGSTASSGNAFSVTNTGDGGSGLFSIVNSNTTAAALTASTSGTGPALTTFNYSSGPALVTNYGNVLFKSGHEAMGSEPSLFAWSTELGALRAGYVSESGWDDDIGPYSVSLGQSLASNWFATALGQYTSASGIASIAAGSQTSASGNYSLAFGYGGSASGTRSIALGSSSIASNDDAVAIGFSNAASGLGAISVGTASTSSGDYAISAGFFADASGDYSTAMGYYVSTNGHDGTFVYGDNSTNAGMNATADNQFMVRASGGTIFYSNSGLTSGVSLAAGGGSWSSVSDRNKKENFRSEDGESLLSRLASVPVTSWNYKAQDRTIRHMGPMAQDFFAAFGLGESDTTITSVDIDGVNMLAIQALEKRTSELRAAQSELQAKAAEIDSLRAQYHSVSMENQELATRLKRLEEAVKALVSQKPEVSSESIGQVNR
jgi:hypothetical protein